MYLIRRLIYMLKTPQYHIELKEVIHEGEGTKTYLFEKPKKLHWEGGASTHLAFDDGISRINLKLPLVRHMSFQTLPSEERVGFTTRVPGSESVFKKRLENLCPGQTMTVFGIHNVMNLVRNNRPVVLISMGVGIATMRPLMLEFAESPEGVPKMISIHVDRIETNIYEDTFKAMAVKNLEMTYLKSRKNLQAMVRDIAVNNHAVYYIVGSNGFLKTVIDQLKGHGVEPADIHIDKHPPFRKNFGL